MAGDEGGDERIERRRRAVALVAALHRKDDAEAEAIIARLVDDPDPRRVIGALGVMASGSVETLARATGKKPEDILAELEAKMTSAPTT